MKKLESLGKLLSKAEQKKIAGGYGGGDWHCNCYNNNQPEIGVDKDCACQSSIADCCGQGYTQMNCFGC
ncbi:MAG TPA: hypothetical protein VI233_09475 [Puia sp.]